MTYSVTSENNKKCKEIETNHLLALCEVFEDYKSFCEDLEDLIYSKRAENLVSKIYRYIMHIGICISNRKYNAFIEKHKHTITIMKKYGSLGDFTLFSYDSKGNKINCPKRDYFYQYIEEHKEDFETIKKVVSKIKYLGIDKITFGEHLDFTTMEGHLIEHALNTSYDCNFAFLENMEVIPTYLNNPIRYTTNSSSYCIHLRLIHFYGREDEIATYGRRIELNSLIFNPDRLPNEITRESTIGVIKGLAEKKKEEYEDIQSSVNISISTSNLKNEFESLKKNYEKIDKLKDNQELKNLLTQMQNIIAQLQFFEENFEQEVIDTHEGIFKDTITKEKNAELNKRYSTITE